MPKTIMGKWSVWLAVALFVLIALVPTLDATFYKGVEAGDTIVQDLTIRPFLAIPALLGMLSGLLAFVTGLIALMKFKDRAVLVYVSTLLGALLLLFIVGDAFSSE